MFTNNWPGYGSKHLKIYHLFLDGVIQLHVGRYLNLTHNMDPQKKMAAGHKWGWTPNIWPFENHVKGKMDFLNHWILWDPVKAGKPRDVLNA